MSQPFWDRYLEYEERQEAQDRVLALLVRIIRLPLQHLSLYFDRLRNLTHKLPVSELVPADVLTRFQAEVAAEAAASGGSSRTELEVERDVRAKIDSMYYEIQMATATEVNKRWNPELALGHQFFHTVELSHEQLNAWRKYLDLEEAEGNYRRIQCLYERCVVVCALYEEFWFRYVRWMSSQAGKEEELRSIFIRAAFFVPVSRPGIRMQWAYFEESCGRIGIAQDIHAAILMKLSDCIEVIVSWAHLQRRQEGLEAAVQVLKDQIDAPTVDLYTKASLVAEWAMMLWKFKGSAEQARAVFLKNAQWYGDSRTFWERWFQFELEQPTTTAEGDSEISQRVKHVFDEFRSKSRLSATVKQQLAHIYLDFLIRHGGKGSMREYLTIDREMFGPSSVAAVSKGQESTGENGAPEQLDEPRRKKAEAPLVFFFETFTDPNTAATGPAEYH